MKKTAGRRLVLLLAIIFFFCVVSLVSSDKNLELEDYNIKVDPSPTTKASIRGGPIEHGSPLNPFIPKLPPSPPPLPQP